MPPAVNRRNTIESDLKRQMGAVGLQNSDHEIVNAVAQGPGAAPG
jgi:hypothetical protein